MKCDEMQRPNCEHGRQSACSVPTWHARTMSVPALMLAPCGWTMAQGSSWLKDQAVPTVPIRLLCVINRWKLPHNKNVTVGSADGTGTIGTVRIDRSQPDSNDHKNYPTNTCTGHHAQSLVAHAGLLFGGLDGIAGII